MLAVAVGILTALSSFAPVAVARVRAPERPVVPNVTATSPTEIKMSWCRVKPNNIEVDHYELFIDNELEYSGNDVMYIAKRLKPWSWYEVKLRACGFQPGFSCSPFSRPILVKTLASGENNTAIDSTATVFKKVVLPTYMFVAGVLVGAVVLAMALIWRYLQTNDTWMNESAFELPTHLQSQDKQFLKGKSAKWNSFVLSTMSVKSVKSQEALTDDPPGQLHPPSGTNLKVTYEVESESNTKRQETSVQTVDPLIQMSNNKVDKLDKCATKTEEECFKSLECKVEKIEALNKSSIESDQLYHELHQSNDNGNTACEMTYKELDISPNQLLHQSIVDQPDTPRLFNQSDSETLFEPCNDELMNQSNGVVVVVDNSNIYIGAQECAAANNASEKKRHVRLKLQNLVKILEKGRHKERTFVCGSSPPATEHVWDIYRHLGYVVDLEERRGKDEQRVDEGLHLFIYKAICELSPRVLVLASGDGMKGKSENSTSFPGCAVLALERGWTVELYSWKHSTSAEWLKLAKKYPEQLTILYLDKYVNQITFVDGKHGRRCLPLATEYSKERHGRLIYHNG